MESVSATLPVGYDLYLGQFDEHPSAELVPQLRALTGYLRAQQYCLERVSTRGSFSVDYRALAAAAVLRPHWPPLEMALRKQPELFLALLGLAMYQLLWDDSVAEGGDPAALPRPPQVVARLCGLSPLTRVRNIKSACYGKLVAVKGTVVRVSNVSPYCLSMAFECTACCEVHQHALPDGNYQAPARCNKCNGTQFRPIKSFKSTRTVDRQTFRLQELGGDDGEEGRVPRTIECELLADLVDSCVPGDIVSVCGRVCTFDNPESGGSRSSKANGKNMYLLYLAINSLANVKAGGSAGSGGVHFTKRDYYAIRELHGRPDTLRLLVHSLCPAIFGHHMVKAGLLLGLFGGTSRPAGGTQDLHVRGDPHILLMGDPGLGKSQLLQAASAAAPRGVYVCGNTSTTAGLTVTLTRDKHDYLLEAGALVLADQGCCCIDEFDKMSAHYQPLLEAMEQQSVSIAKSGILCTLPARASVLAAANPSGGHYNRDRTLQQNLKMGAALLSRFDLVFVLLDRPDGALDTLVSGHIMALHASTGARTSSLDTSLASSADSDWSQERPLAERLAAPPGPDAAAVPPAMLRKYIAYARKYVHPRLSDAACRSLQQFFLQLRARQQTADTMAVTTRQLESLIRLTQARARLDLREEATADDADDVIQLVRFSLAVCGDDADSAPPARAARRPRGKSGQLRAFVELVRQTASRLGKAVFTDEELRQMVSQTGGSQHFREFVDTANQSGVLLKRGPQLYQVQMD